MSVGNFAILTFVDPIGIVTTPSGIDSPRAKCMGVSVGLPVDHVWNAGSDLQAGVEIYYWEHTEIWLISSSQNDPILGPQFPLPCGQLAAPFLEAHREPGPKFKLYTQI